MRGGHTRQTSLTALLAKAVGVVATAVRRAPFTWIHGAQRGNACGYVAVSPTANFREAWRKRINDRQVCTAALGRCHSVS